MIRVGADDKAYIVSHVRHELMYDREVTQFFVEDLMVDEHGMAIKYPDGNYVKYRVHSTVWENMPSLKDGDKIRLVNISSWNPYQVKTTKTLPNGKDFFKYVIRYSMCCKIEIVKSK